MANPSNSTIQSRAYNAVVSNEVGNSTATADSISAPLASGSSGWTIGFNQQDFKGNPSAAQSTLTSALVASGDFTQSTAQSIGKALTTAGTSSTVDLSGHSTVSGQAATIQNIDQALQSSAGAASIANSSLADFNSSFNTLNSSVFQSSQLNASVASALGNSTDGAALQIVLADYNNQYHLSTTGSSTPMWNLLTSGTGTFSGNTVTLNTASAATVLQSVETAYLDTAWVAKGYGPQACSRLANDVAQANAYDTSRGAAGLGTQKRLRPSMELVR